MQFLQKTNIPKDPPSNSGKEMDPPPAPMKGHQQIYVPETNEWVNKRKRDEPECPPAPRKGHSQFYSFKNKEWVTVPDNRDD